MEAPKSSFRPVVDTNTKVLILGSLPGEMSLQARQYYARPSNQFWRLIGAVIRADLIPKEYDDRLAALLHAGIGLWDTVKTAVRTGSGDSAIRAHEANPLYSFAREIPSLQALTFNGAKSALIGRRELPDTYPFVLIDLPSSSAAYCSISFDQKLEKWMAIRRYL